MHVTIRYFAQIRHAAGVDRDVVELPEGATLRQAVAAACGTRGDGVRALALTADGGLQPSVLFAVNGVPVRRNPDHALKPGDEITIMTPMSGG